MKTNILIPLSIFSFLFWLDFFISIGKAEINPMYQSTNKFIAFPIIIISVLLLKKFYSPKLKLPLIFLLSLFCFALVWNIGSAYAEEVTIINHADTDHQASSLTSGILIAQRIDDVVFGNAVIRAGYRLGCGSNTILPISYGIAEVDSSNTIVTVLFLGNTTIPAEPSSTGSVRVLNFTTPTALPTPTSGHHYILFANHSTNLQCGGINNIVTTTRASGTDSSGENALTYSYTSPTQFSNYIGATPANSGNPTSQYAIVANGTVTNFNQSSTKTFTSSHGGEGYSLTTDPIVFPSDCSASSMNATLTHSISLYNGTSPSSQSAIATTEFILPSSNQFSNTTLINWDNQLTKNLNLAFSKTNYVAGDTVQGKCTLSMNNNLTFVTSNCNLNLVCSRIVATAGNGSVSASPTGMITEKQANEVLNFFLSPFMILTMIAFAVAGLLTVSLGKYMEKHGGVVFMGILFIMFFGYTIVGFYPLFVGIVMIIVIGLILTKMIIGFLKGD